MIFQLGIEILEGELEQSQVILEGKEELNIRVLQRARLRGELSSNECSRLVNDSRLRGHVEGGERGDLVAQRSCSFSSNFAFFFF